MPAIQIAVFFVGTVADEKKSCAVCRGDILKEEKELSLDCLQNRLISGAECTLLSDVGVMAGEVLVGSTLVFAGSGEKCLAVNCRETQGRGIAEPPTVI